MDATATGHPTRMMTRRRRLAAALMATAFLAGVLAPGQAAFAASYKSISGTVWSDSSYWYVSTTVRTKEGTGGIYAEFYTLPYQGIYTHGIYFEVVDNNQPCSFCWVTLPPGNKYFGSSSGEQLIASNVPSGKQFRNHFRRSSTCQEDDCHHDFTGREWY